MKSRAKGRKERTFPAAPLRAAMQRLALIEAWDRNDPRQRGPCFGDREKKGMDAFCRQRGIVSRNLYRPTLTDWSVDAICIAAGIHPSEVYGDWFTMSDRLTRECEVA